MADKFNIPKPSKIKAKWSWEEVAAMHGWQPPKKIFEMTEEEKQDEVIRRLKNGLRKNIDVEEELVAIITQQMAEEIDKEIVRSLMEIHFGSKKI